MALTSSDVDGYGEQVAGVVAERFPPGLPGVVGAATTKLGFEADGDDVGELAGVDDERFLLGCLAVVWLRQPSSGLKQAGMVMASMLPE